MNNRCMSLVIPAYNEEKNIKKATDRICRILDVESIPFEIIFVDDGSQDGTWEEILKASTNDKRIHGIRFSRNFGKEAALSAGLFEAKGDCCAVLDCDMQHPPEKLPTMYKLWLDGYEVVACIKSKRGKESFIYKAFTAFFYSIISKVTCNDMRNASDYKLLDRKAIDAILQMKEKNSFFRALSGWVGFKTTTVEFEVEERTEGETKWSTWGLIKYAINNISSFSAAPLQLVTVLGVLLFLASLILSLIAIIQKVKGIALQGFTTVIIFQGFSSSIIMVCLGIIGYYIAKIYDEIKARPRYIVSEKTENEE